MNGWTSRKLGDVCKITSGNSINAKEKEENFTNLSRGTPYIATKDISFNGIIDYDNGIRIPLDKRKNFRLAEPETTFICAEGGSAGRKIAFSDQECFFVNKLFGIKPKTNLVSKYVYYYALSDYFQRQFRLVLTGIIGGVSISKIKEFEIPLPPLPVQKAIVAKLDAAFASIEQAITAAERNAENAKQLFQSYLSDVFEKGGDGWEKKHLEDVAIEFGRGKSKHRPRNDPALYGGVYPFLQTGDVRNAGKYVIDYSQTYNENGLKQSKKWPKGTLCITIAANIAEVSILGFEACFPDSIIGLVVDHSKADVEFIYYSLLFTQKILKAKGKGSAQDNINQGTFEDMKFKFPDLDMQKITVQNLHEIGSVIEEVSGVFLRKIELLAALKQSLLQQAFNGQLVDA